MSYKPSPVGSALPQYISYMTQTITFIFTLPYAEVYKRNTSDPLHAIVQERDTVRLVPLMERWIRLKRRELEYVSVAGAVVFATVPTCLTWSDIMTSHWSARACWHISIILAITSVVIAAQHTLKLSTLQQQDYPSVRGKFTQSRTRTMAPRNSMLYLWQMPLQCLSYSFLFFLAGYFSYVFAPLTDHGWDPDAKTATIFGIAICFASISYICSSVGVRFMDS